LFTSEAAAKQTMIAQLNYDILCVLFRFLDECTLKNCLVVNKEFSLLASQNLYRVVLASLNPHIGLGGVSTLVKAVLSTEMAD
jgi:hypothetical protein